MSDEVKVYTVPTCSFCKMTKEFLTQKGIAFSDHDVSTDAEAREEMSRVSGQGLSVPVISVGETVIVGFNKDRLEQALKDSGLT